MGLRTICARVNQSSLTISRIRPPGSVTIPPPPPCTGLENNHAEYHYQHQPNNRRHFLSPLRIGRPKSQSPGDRSYDAVYPCTGLQPAQSGQCSCLPECVCRKKLRRNCHQPEANIKSPTTTGSDSRQTAIHSHAMQT